MMLHGMVIWWVSYCFGVGKLMGSGRGGGGGWCWWICMATGGVAAPEDNFRRVSSWGVSVLVLDGGNGVETLPARFYIL